MAPKVETTAMPSLEQLFDDYARTAHETFNAMEIEFGFSGMVEHFLGGDNSGSIFQDKQLPKVVVEHIQNSHAWKLLVELHDFAMNGVAPDEDTSFIVTNAAEVMDLVGGHVGFSLHAAWKRLVWQADGRHGLDNGYPLEYEKLAYLADVDIRTVRNAVSAGHLIKVKTKSEGPEFIENESARKWLAGRRGFKPTVFADQTQATLVNVNSPLAFGAALKAQRSRIEEGGDMLLSQHPGITEQVLKALESGSFELPLSMVNPVADYYRLVREQFLSSVMRVFFPEQLAVIQSFSNVN